MADLKTIEKDDKLKEKYQVILSGYEIGIIFSLLANSDHSYISKSVDKALSIVFDSGEQDKNRKDILAEMSKNVLLTEMYEDFKKIYEKTAGRD